MKKFIGHMGADYWFNHIKDDLPSDKSAKMKSILAPLEGKTWGLRKNKTEFE